MIQLPTIDTSQQLIEVYAWWRHYWSDERVSWDPDAWGGVDALTFKGQGGEIEQIWVPDLHVYETVNQYNALPEIDVNVYPSGSVFVSYPIVHTLQCRMDLSK